MSAAQGLVIEHLTVRYGGLVAVDGVSFEAPVGQLTGLIGPNGAGKTTMFNACSGLARAAGGRVHFRGRDVTRWSPAARAQLGIGRTFQRMQLFDSLTVAENVAMGREAGLIGTNPLRQLVARPGEHREVAEAVSEALERCGLEAIARRRAGELSTGQRRLVELARALAGRFELLLLDEPSSGLDHGETRTFGRILRDVVAERGQGILLVEHDMELVMSVCDHIYVLDFGKLVFQGAPKAVQGSDVVRSAYLGTEAVAC